MVFGDVEADYVYVAGCIGLEEVEFILGEPYVVLVWGFGEFGYEDHFACFGKPDSGSLRWHLLCV